MSAVDEEMPGRVEPTESSETGESGSDRGSKPAESLLESLERAELEQPLVFFREGWDFRWMTGRQVLARAGLGDPGSTIVDERGDFEEPLELTQFTAEIGALLRGRIAAPPSEPEVAVLGRELRKVLGRRRPSIVVPGSRGEDSRFVLRLGLELGAAFVLPPDPSAYVWTVCSTRPTIVAAAPERLQELAADLGARSRWRRRRLVSATRFVLELGSGRDRGQDALPALVPLLGKKTTVRPVVLRPSR